MRTVILLTVMWSLVAAGRVSVHAQQQERVARGNDESFTESDVQHALDELRESVNQINQRLQRLETRWQNRQVSTTHAQVWTMSSDGRNARPLVYAPGFQIINSPEVSPDGRSVAVDGWREGERLTAARLLIIDIESGKVNDLGAGAMPHWSPDGKWIAFCKYGDERGVHIRSLDGAVQRHIDPEGWGMQWSPDGSKVAYTRGNKFVVHDFIAARSRDILPADWDYTRIYWNPAWSPDSKEICFKARHRQGHTEFAIINVSAEVPTVRRRISADGFLEDIAWHPDGRRILIPRGGAGGVYAQIYEFDPATDEQPKQLAGQPADRHNLGMCWSHDGKSLYYISRK